MAQVNIRDRNKNKPDKKPNWEYRFEAAKIGGKRKHISKAGFSTKREALNAGNKALAEYNESGMIFEPTEVSVIDYLNYWFENHCKLNLRYNTQLGYRSIIDNHLVPKLGGYRLKSLNPTVIQEYANEIGLCGYSKSHIIGILSCLKSALDYAVFPLKYIKENPVSYITRPNTGLKRRERIVLSQEDFKEIIEKFPFGNRFHIPLLIGWHCGLRVSETCALTWNDIDLDKNEINVNKQLIKRNYDEETKRTVPLWGRKEESCGWYFTETKDDSNGIIKFGKQLAEILKKEYIRQIENEKHYNEYYIINIIKHEKDEKGKIIERVVSVPKCIETSLKRVNLVCLNERGELTTSDSMRYVNRVVKTQLKITFDYHTLRNSHATMLIENGADPKAVQRRMRHKSVITTYNSYVKVTEKMQDSIIEIIDKNVDKK